ncbi:MAG: preprotein translocase subunit SecE [Steroidobacteraceae bacterium]
MTDETKVQEAGPADKAKVTVAILLVIAGIAGYYLLADKGPWLRWAPVVGGLVFAALVVAFSVYGTEFRRFVELSRGELRKIVWPTRDETLKTTGVVFLFVVVFGVFFWALDFVLAWATKYLTGQGGG